jgi:NADPH:quinone reductase-like Zn-dependent oxidoreductase
LSADEVIDYTKGDVTRSGGRYDVVLGINGYHPLLAYRRILVPGGVYIMVGGDNNRLLRSMFQVMALGPLLSRAGGQQLKNMLAQPTQQDLEFLSGLLAEGRIKPVIDRSYPLRATADAFRYYEREHARGKVVITVDQESVTA